MLPASDTSGRRDQSVSGGAEDRKLLPAVVAIGGLPGTAAGADAAATTSREYAGGLRQGAATRPHVPRSGCGRSRGLREHRHRSRHRRTSDTEFAAEVAGSAAIGRRHDEPGDREGAAGCRQARCGRARRRLDPWRRAVRRRAGRRPARRAAVGHADDPCHPEGSYARQQGSKAVRDRHHRHRTRCGHPDIAPNFDARLSRNFTVDDPCRRRVETDPDAVLRGPRRTSTSRPRDARRVHDRLAPERHRHGGRRAQVVSSTCAPARTRATSSSARLDALTYAGDHGIDVVNMSYYIDPWLYNCTANPADSPAEQRSSAS